ncbi:MAG: tetratricopeptide repeat protein [Pseudomonadota bacterium]|nr:MAG: tetratricopeptide repeat protein [Pseudomonadota bacterium]
MKRMVSMVLLALVALTGCEREPLGPSAEQIERNNRGVALMGQYRNEEARQVFAQLGQERPGWLDVQVNEAIATLNRQQEGDEQRALAMVEAVLDKTPDHARARYIAALMHYYLGQTERALGHFEQVLDAVPGDAHVAYFTAQTLVQLGQEERALELYRRAIDLDPYLRSAYYGAALVLRKRGDPEQARSLLADYQRFEDNPRAHLAEFRYTRMGPLAEALAVDQSAGHTPQPLSDGPVFDTPELLVEWSGTGTTASLTAADINADGHPDLFLSDGTRTRVLLGHSEGFERAEDHPLSGIDGVTAAAWGDVDNDGNLDVYLCRRGANQLRTSAGNWALMAGSSDVGDSGDCQDVALFDADHDGDLDLFVVNANTPNELFSNNLDGSWRRLSHRAEVNLGGHGAGRQVLIGDLDRDRDADIVVLHDDGPHQVFVNDRLWRYRISGAFDRFAAGDHRAVTAADFDADGQLELVTVNHAGVLSLWRPDDQGDWQSRPLIESGLPVSDLPRLTAADFTGDGRPDILVHHGEGFELITVGAGASARIRVSEAVRLGALLPLLRDPATGPELLGLVAVDPAGLMRWPAGDGRGRFAALAPTGRSEQADGMRSNASGIGTGIAARVGSRWSLSDTYDRHSAPGQSLQPVAIGLGGDERIDFVRLSWTDGVMQTELALPAGEVHRIAETQRQLASCPVLFAYNGERFEFVSDLLGVAGIGFFHAPGEYSEPRPWEYFRFPEGSIAPREGRYAIKIGEPMEEVAYLDTARLHVHDLPPGWSLALDERMHTGGGPAPSGEPVFYRDETLRGPVRAVNERGEDVTSRLSQVDFEAAPPGERDRRFLGRLSGEHLLELEFGEPINPAGTRPVLIIDGWVEYPYSQTVFAAWQAGADYAAPSLEARADGRWQMVHEHFGYPAGMPREMSLPLDGLPEGTTALRLRTNLEIYFDRIAVVAAEAAPAEAASRVIEPGQARLERTGFARRETLDQRRPYYDYADRSPFWDTRAPTGYYTAFGPVNELVAAADEAFAVIGPGEEVHFEFPAPPAPPDGFRREIVLEVRGYAKDMDLYTRDGETVEPVPGDDHPRRQALHEAYLNRFRGGE